MSAAQLKGDEVRPARSDVRCRCVLRCLVVPGFEAYTLILALGWSRRLRWRQAEPLAVYPEIKPRDQVPRDSSGSNPN